MLGDLGMSEGAYALGAGIFSIGYCVLEVPSNLILSRVGARRWIARILVSWGLISAGMMFVTGPWSFSLLRFLLGCAEAGFFPGIVLYLTYWFPARQRARAVALLMMASPLVWMLGGPLSGALLQYMDRLAGLAGWQWLFLLEGLPAVVLGVVTLFYLTDRPEAGDLADAGRTVLAGGAAGPGRTAAGAAPRSSLRQAAADRRVWHLVALATTIALGISGLSYYFPGSSRTAFPASTPFEIGLLTAVSGTCTLLGIVAVGSHSDRTGERRWHVAGPAFLAAAGWGLSVWREVPVVSFAGDGAGAGGHDEHVGPVLVAGDRASSAAGPRREGSPSSTRSATWGRSSARSSWVGCWRRRETSRPGWRSWRSRWCAAASWHWGFSRERPAERRKRFPVRPTPAIPRAPGEGGDCGSGIPASFGSVPSSVRVECRRGGNP